MSLERLPFTNTDLKYHSYLAAQHIARYSVARKIVEGKRVLDIACGEGYGSFLLLEWGAKEVIGVDSFPGAIHAARRVFGRDGATYIVGNAETLDDVLADVEPFDLIVSLETIEHVANPDKFLASLNKLIKDDGTIIISCPNDYFNEDAPAENPFHLNLYSFSEFKILTEKHLGEASMWMLGCPVLGQFNYIPGDSFVEQPHDDLVSITWVKDIENTVLIPAQSNLITSEKNCNYYIGVWGTTLSPNAAISTQSPLSFQEPWQTIDYLQSKVRELNEACSEQDEKKSIENEAFVEDLRAQNVKLKEDLAHLSFKSSEHYDPEIQKYKDELVQHKESVERLNELRAAELETALNANKERYERVINEQKQEIDKYILEIANFEEQSQESERLFKSQNLRISELEHEVEKLKSHVEHSKFEKEVQILRRRLISKSNTPTQLVEFAEAERQQLLAENQHLHKVVANYEKTKSEWWDPELERRARRIAELESKYENG